MWPYTVQEYDFISHAPAARPTATIRRPFDVMRLLRLWARRIREREELAHMTDRELQDIRLTASEAAWLIRKPFWRD